jgi:putative membrane protein
MIRSLIAAAALALPAAAFAQTPATVPSSPTTYILMAGQSDAFEIQSSQLAQQKAMSPDVKRFAAQMITDHTRSTQMVQAAAMKSGMTVPPPSLGAEQQRMMSDLQGQSGAAFDSAYMADQLQAHRVALALHTGFAQTGADANLKATAGQIAPVVQMHLTMLQSMGGR